MAWNRCIPILLGAAIFAGSPGPAAAQNSFDGSWSVLIITEAGQCDRAYRYPIVIRNGEIGNAGMLAFAITGRVEKGGTVRVTIRHNQDRADASGRLAGKWGTGTWNLATRGCSGRWRAERRARSG